MKFKFTNPALVNRVLATLLVTVSIATVSYAQPGRNGRNDIGPGKSIESDRGFLFVDAVYLSPPYTIEFEEDSICINGEKYTADSFDLSGYSNRGRGMRGGGFRGMSFRGGDRFRNEEMQESATFNLLWAASRDFSMLSAGAIVVLKSEAPPMVVWPSQHGFELLESLLATSSNAKRSADLPDAVRSSADQETWRHLVANFHSTPDFVERATKLTEELNAIELNAERQFAAVQLSQRISYPLTMFAIVLVVIAVGHLLSNAAQANLDSDDPKVKQTIKKSTISSLVILGMMSVIDLVWTLIAHQSGSMREMNPLGSRLIADPIQLIAFKIVVTSISIGLLFWLRELPLARKAIWWCCLVLTLLTARWVTFQSLFA
ncbi:DUF5658 family protein [Aporhodopirellula aestuarii]|uniref:DUF5658 family protein n=1 Tax=Aporhodopirellula aestuarii TaxID=2950107 RepID=A0ABT0TZG7_9BACT|nr:DUF5658 family protein [Aporhodopirellula aestuarii]MCM2369957.1 DUF5658 family protein [Aporhodopirellula aestuarii]